MHRRTLPYWALPLVLIVAACAGNPDDSGNAANADADAQVAPQTATPLSDAGGSLACAPMVDRMALAGRASPYDSATIPLGDAQAKICYNRPSARGRTMLGGELPYGTLWRTGANEPTTVHIPLAATIAGVAVQPGSYSIYSIPGEREWTVIVNRSISQWGADDYAGIEAQEVGRATVASQTMPEHAEQFTIRAEPSGQDANLILEWENTRVVIPIVPA